LRGIVYDKSNAESNCYFLSLVRFSQLACVEAENDPRNFTKVFVLFMWFSGSSC
jgi:hypothetical protein